MPYIAGIFIGAKIANLETTDPEEATEILRQLEPAAIFVSFEYEKFVECCLNGIRSKIIVFGKTTRNTNYESIFDGNTTLDHYDVHRPESLKETVFICYTRDMNPRPTGACITQETVLYQCQNFS